MKVLKKDFKLDVAIGYAVNMVANKARQELENTFAINNYDITAPQWMVLSIIHENEGINQNELSKLSRKDKTNVTRIIEKLERKGLVKRVRDEFDKRVFRLYQTQKGKDTRSHLSELTSSLISKSTVGITDDEYGVCMKVLNKMYENML